MIHGHKAKKADWSFALWLQSMSEEIYRTLMIGCFFLQITLVSLTPIVGKFAFGLCLCWLYALYSFELRAPLTSIIEAKSHPTDFLCALVQVPMEPGALGSGTKNCLL